MLVFFFFKRKQCRHAGVRGSSLREEILAPKLPHSMLITCTESERARERESEGARDRERARERVREREKESERVSERARVV